MNGGPAYYPVYGDYQSLSSLKHQPALLWVQQPPPYYGDFSVAVPQPHYRQFVAIECQPPTPYSSDLYFGDLYLGPAPQPMANPLLAGPLSISSEPHLPPKKIDPENSRASSLIEILASQLSANDANSKVNILDMPLENFKEISNAFEELFESATFSNFGYTAEQQANPFVKKKILDHQTNLIFLYMAFSLYVLKHAKIKGTKAWRGKLKIVTALNLITYQQIGCTLKLLINSKPADLTDNLSFHQRLLMINCNLFAFAKILIDHAQATKNNGLLENILQLLPLEIPASKLRQSKEKANNRTMIDPGHTENEVNISLIQILRQDLPDFIFKPQKMTPNSKKMDKVSGLELDFPLDSFVTIETDGPHHFSNNRRALIDYFKNTALQEAGWIRGSISTNSDCIKPARNIAYLLLLPQVTAFVKEYIKLNTLRQTIRAKIIEVQKEYQQLKQEAYRPIYHNHFNALFNFERLITSILLSNNLSAMLSHPMPDESIIVFTDYFQLSERLRDLTIKHEQSLLEVQKKRKDLAALKEQSEKSKNTEKEIKALHSKIKMLELSISLSNREIADVKIMLREALDERQVREFLQESLPTERISSDHQQITKKFDSALLFFEGSLNNKKLLMELEQYSKDSPPCTPPPSLPELTSPPASEMPLSAPAALPEALQLELPKVPLLAEVESPKRHGKRKPSEHPIDDLPPTTPTLIFSQLGLAPRQISGEPPLKAQKPQEPQPQTPVAEAPKSSKKQQSRKQ